MGLLIGLGVGVLVLFLLALGTFFIVEQQSVAVIERLGKFSHTANAGLNLKIPLIDNVVSRVNLRVTQLEVEVETKTKDNVFVKTVVSVQYYVDTAKVYDAYYRLNNPEAQIKSYIFDVVRAEVPKLELDEVFAKKDGIANAIKSELSETMGEFGFNIQQSLLTDIDPDSQVKAAMNEINAAKRMKEAAYEKAEAEKIKVVKAAEAEAESKELQGKGIAAQRKAIVDGLNTSIVEFKKGVEGATTNDVMSMVLLTQYFDTLNHVSNASSTNTIFLPHSPNGLSDLSAQIRNGVMQGNAGLDSRLNDLINNDSEENKKSNN